MNDGRSSRLTIPAALVALLALLGIVNAPGRQAGGGAQGGAAPAAEDSDGAAGGSIVIGDADPAPALRAFGMSAEQRAADQLEILAPLQQFYAPRLGGSGEPALSDEKLVQDLLDGVPDGDRPRDELELLIAIVPHPSRSGSPYRFDNSIAAIGLAMRQARYFLDGYRIPWLKEGGPSAGAGRSRESVTVTGPMGASLEWERGDDDGEPDDRAHQPGLLLFRRYPKEEQERRAPDDTSHGLVAALLVTDTPILGVDPAMLARALDLALLRWEVAGGDHSVPPVRIVGPDFSGSPSSIARTMDAWVARHEETLATFPAAGGKDAPIAWIAGVALAVADKPLLGRSAGAVPPARLYRYEMVTHSVGTFTSALMDFIRSQSSEPARVAILSEETTGWGGAFAKGAEEGAKGAEAGMEEADEREGGPAQQSRGIDGKGTPRLEVYRYTFPVHIAEVRRRYQQSERSTGESERLRTAERIDVALGEGAETPEQVATAAPATTAANDEMRMLRVAEDIDRRGIGHVILHATDMRDTIFVAEYLRAHCPDTRLYGFVGEQAFTQQHRIGAMRGMVFAMTYPLYLQNQLWTRPQRDREEADTRDLLALPGHAGIGVYNATLAHLVELAHLRGEAKRCQDLFEGMIGYGRPYDPTQPTPPVWLAITSQRGFYPLTVGPPPGGKDPPVYLWTPPEGADEGRRDGAGVGARGFRFDEARGWSVVFLAATAALLAISLLYLCTYVSLFVLGREIRRGGPAAARRHPSALLDHLGYASLRRDVDPSHLDVRHRRRSHVAFKLVAWVGYTVLATPVWGLDPIGDAGVGSGMGPRWWTFWWTLHAIVFVPTWLLALGASVASLDVWAERLRQRPEADERRPRRRPEAEERRPRRWLHLAAVAAATLAIAAGLAALVYSPPTHRLTLEPSAGPALDRFRVALYCTRAAELTSGVSPMLPLLLLVGAAAYATYHRLRTVWAVRPLGGRGADDPVPLGTGRPALDAHLEARKQLKEVSQHGFWWLWKRRPLIFGLVVAALIGIAVAIARAWLEASVTGLEPVWIGVLLAAGLVVFFGALIMQIAHLLVLSGAIEEATSATLALPMAGAFDRLPPAVAEQFGSYVEAIQGEHAGDLAMPLIEQQEAEALRAALETGGAGLDAEAVRRLRELLKAQADRRQGDAIARACVALLLPIWRGRPADRAYPGPSSPPHGPDAQGGPPAVARAESFVAMELLRDLNRPITALWIELTTVTVLGLLLLMVVNSYPYRIAGHLFGLAVLTVVAAAGVIARVLWGVQGNALIRRVSGTGGRSAFNAEFLGRLVTYVAPLVLGLIAALSFAASDVLRVVLGPLLG